MMMAVPVCRSGESKYNLVQILTEGWTSHDGFYFSVSQSYMIYGKVWSTVAGQTPSKAADAFEVGDQWIIAYFHDFPASC